MKRKRSGDGLPILSSSSSSTKRKKTRNEECAICLEALNEGVFVFNCKHEFHVACVAKLRSKKLKIIECPICRSEHLCTDVDLSSAESRPDREEIIKYQLNRFDEEMNRALQKSVFPPLIESLMQLIGERHRGNQTVQNSFELRVHIETINRRLRPLPPPIPVIVWVHY